MNSSLEHPMVVADARRRTDAARSSGLQPALGTTDVAVLGLLIAAIAGFGVYGLMTGAPSTVSYVLTVSGATALFLKFRPATVSQTLTISLAVLAIAHLAGGLIRAGNDVLYNASIGSDAVEYDHFVHTAGVFLGVLVLWTFLPSAAVGRTDRRILIGLCVLAGLGLGAINETVEYLTTLAHDGSHIGGYTNTGWDLVSNVVGGTTAGLWLHHHRHGGRPAESTSHR